MSTPKAVVFDVGGTLVEPLGTDLVAALARTLGLDDAATHVLRMLLARNVFPSPAALAERVRAELGVLDDPREAVAAYWQAAATRPVPRADAATCVAAVRAAGARVGIIGTLATPEAEAFRRACSALVPLVDAWQLSCETGSAKPSAAAFSAVLDALGVTPARALVVGDDLAEDVEPALALGMSAIWLRPAAPEPASPVTVDPHGAPVPVPAVVVPESAVVARNFMVVRRLALTWLWAARGERSGLTAPLAV
jgi:putative hydrolase of the HAD superfamily